MKTNIKEIFDHIASEPSNNKKMDILNTHKDNELLKRVLYLANSKRVKFFIKQIPHYICDGNSTWTLSESLGMIQKIADREYTGHDAINYLKEILESSTKDDAYIIERIIEKDCKIGLGTSFINRVFPNLIEETAYMGAKPYDIKLVKKLFVNNKTAFSQLKADGRYCASVISNSEVELESRSGEPTILTNSALLKELSTFGDDIVLTGELTLDGISSKYSGSAIRTVSNGIIASIIDICGKVNERTEKETNDKISAFEKKHGGDFEKGSITLQEALDSIIYHVWDIISIDEYNNGKSNTPYKERLNKITSLINEHNPKFIRLIESKEVNNVNEAFEHFKNILDSGLEGTILKSTDDGWRDGKPTYCVKLKLEMEVDLIITGFNYGTKGTKNEFLISSLNAESACGKLKTRPQGINEDKMVYITENQDKLLNTVISVKCNGVSKPKDSDIYSLLYPAFMGFRSDEKNTADSIDDILKIEKSAIELALNK